MALCEFSKLVGGPCSASTDYPSNVTCVFIGECDRDVKGHLKFCKISGDIAVKNESRLLFVTIWPDTIWPQRIHYIMGEVLQFPRILIYA